MGSRAQQSGAGHAGRVALPVWRWRVYGGVAVVLAALYAVGNPLYAVLRYRAARALILGLGRLHVAGAPRVARGPHDRAPVEWGERDARAPGGKVNRG